MPSYKSYLTHKNTFLFGLFLIIVGMPLSKFLMSVGQFILFANWLLEGDFKRKWMVMKTSKVLWVMSSFYLLHLIGLLWTSDFSYAANDLKIKLPLLWFPLLFITSNHSLPKKESQALLWLFSFAVFIASIVCMFVWLGYTKHKVIDIRDISIFNSHIRFALMIDLVICFLLYDFFKTGKLLLYLLKVGLIIWLVTFLGIMQSFTGIVVLFIVFGYYSILFFKNLKNPIFKISAFVTLGILISTALYIITIEIKEQTVPIKSTLRHNKTSNGNPYYNDTLNLLAENGNLIWANVCGFELKQEWNKKSKIKFNEKDLKGNPIDITLIRYLSSRGYRKDSIGISMLSKEDIRLIENGTTNYRYTNNSGIETKIHEIVYEFDAFKRGENPTGHSFLMRLEFWRIGWKIIKRKPLYGVGTGDVQLAYNYQYSISESKLSKTWQKRSHNQFMAITIAFGFIGLLVFILYLFIPVFKVKNKHYLFSLFFLISLFSMLNEDTLETQAGVTFFGFFYYLFLLNKQDKIIM